jgi:hypothetical protein
MHCKGENKINANFSSYMPFDGSVVGIDLGTSHVWRNNQGRITRQFINSVVQSDLKQWPSFSVNSDDGSILSSVVFFFEGEDKRFAASDEAFVSITKRKEEISDAYLGREGKFEVPEIDATLSIDAVEKSIGRKEKAEEFNCKSYYFENDDEISVDVETEVGQDIISDEVAHIEDFEDIVEDQSRVWGLTDMSAGTCVIPSLYPLPPLSSASGNTEESQVVLTCAAKIIANFTSKNELYDSNYLKLKIMKLIDEIAELRARVEERTFSG